MSSGSIFSYNNINFFFHSMSFTQFLSSFLKTKNKEIYIGAPFVPYVVAKGFEGVVGALGIFDYLRFSAGHFHGYSKLLNFSVNFHIQKAHGVHSPSAGVVVENLRRVHIQACYHHWRGQRLSCCSCSRHLSNSGKNW